jgi:CBS domain-containing protein
MATSLTSRNSVSAIMTKKVYLTTPDTPLSDALELMAKTGVQRLPVCDESGKLIGIVSDRY